MRKISLTYSYGILIEFVILIILNMMIIIPSEYMYSYLQHVAYMYEYVVLPADYEYCISNRVYVRVQYRIITSTYTMVDRMYLI